MLKQILGELPRSSSKSSHDESSNDGGVNPYSTANSSQGTNSRNSSKSSECTGEPLNSGSAARTDDSNIGSAGRSFVTHWKKPAASRDEHALTPHTCKPWPSYRDVPSSEKKNLLILRKLGMCCVVFDFSDPNNLREKDIKRKTLLEVVDYISAADTSLGAIVMQGITKMVVANLFRTFPSANHTIKGQKTYDSDDDEPTIEPAWPHLEMVYEVLLRFVCSPKSDARLARRYINHFFVLRLLDLFDSEDARERNYVKTSLCHIYWRFMGLQPYIRRVINNILYTFIFETEKHNGIAELLEVLGNIINRTILPLKKEHYLFLVRVLIPLHKPKCISMYHKQLSYCITKFMEKDCNLAYTVIRGLLKYWTITNSSKEVMFLDELGEVLEATQPADFQRCMVPLFRRIGRCLNSSNAKVSERALFLWNNDHIVKLIIQNRNIILPLIFPALEKNIRDHWSLAVHIFTGNVMKIFADADQELFDECLSRLQEDEAKKEEARMRQELAWKHLGDTVACGVVSNEAVSD